MQVPKDWRSSGIWTHNLLFARPLVEHQLHYWLIRSP